VGILTGDQQTHDALHSAAVREPKKKDNSRVGWPA
jgi:hypothetical protein